MGQIDKELDLVLKSLKRGDITTYERLYNYYFEELCLYALKFTPDRDLIQDVVQDTFVDIWSNRKKLTIRTSMKSYLFRIVYNKLMDAFNKNSKKKNMYASYYESALADFIVTIENDDDYKNELLKKLDACIAELPSRCKNIFLDVKIAGKKYKNVASNLDISIKTIEGHISRAYKLIKECMDDDKRILN